MRLDYRSVDTATMIRYECSSCDMTATMVMNAASGEAWVHHMETHAPDAEFQCWVWEVIPLPFSSTER